MDKLAAATAATSWRWLAVALVLVASAPVVWWLVVWTPWNRPCGAYGLRVRSVLTAARYHALIELERSGELPQTFWQYVFDFADEDVFEARCVWRRARSVAIGPYTLEDWYRGRIDRATLEQELVKRGELGLWESVGDFVFSRDPATLRSFEAGLIVAWDEFRNERHPYNIVLFSDGHAEWVRSPDRLLEADAEARERLGLPALPADAPFHSELLRK